MTDLRLIYVTTRDPDQARMLARSLLEQRLIACANILPQMESLYFWQGKIENESEAVLILKTTEELVPKAMAALESLHSYATPCILSLVVDQGSAKYLDWLRAQVC